MPNPATELPTRHDPAERDQLDLIAKLSSVESMEDCVKAEPPPELSFDSQYSMHPVDSASAQYSMEWPGEEIWLHDAGSYLPTAAWALAAVFVAAAVYTQSYGWDTIAAAWDPGSAFPAY